ncbi:response regulator [Salipaludibacillus sp. LMS25]|jgi:two-component system response regulator YcbB|uniref:DNA-binding domain-containing protein n=1 Tax=Salipaludibacillus sp. LMS25 TaxID=2924031 RepID=UPI0020D1B9C3|nr:DNA-binding domain-containing protein [Salipaludibacillus sp. LMS25]UTR13514.1 response regulator [Salipaludibacillus sp. LMS25]
MNYFIVDDDPAVRGILKHLIHAGEGKVVGDAEDGSHLHAITLTQTETDILIIDLLMPEEDGIDTVRRVSPDFTGKIIMISQVETKEIIAEAYQNKVEAYITKPINRLEVLSVLSKVCNTLKLERSMHQIKNTLHLFNIEQNPPSVTSKEQSQKSHLTACAMTILSDLGIRYEKGADDLIGILQAFLSEDASEISSLKKLWESSLQVNGQEICQRNIKATEQRVRRAIIQAFNHISSLGAIDVTHPKFEYYAMRFFDLDMIQQRIHELNVSQNREKKLLQPRLNIKKFIMAFIDECQQHKSDFFC